MCSNVNHDDCYNNSDSVFMPQNLDMLKKCVQSRVCVFLRNVLHSHVFMVTRINTSIIPIDIGYKLSLKRKNLWLLLNVFGIVYKNRLNNGLN